MPQHRTIVEDENYVRAIAQIGGYRRADQAISTILAALSSCPEAFPLVPGFPLRLAKTRLAIRDLEIVPSIHIWFYIAADETVHLYFAALSAPEEMEYSDEVFQGRKKSSEG